MKYILFLFLSIVSITLADVRAIYVEKVPTGVKVLAYGLLPDGKPKELSFKAAADLLKISNIENSAEFNLGLNALRYWVFFYESDVKDDEGGVIYAAGTVRKIDFHLEPEPNFSQKIFQPSTSQSVNHINTLKTYLDSK